MLIVSDLGPLTFFPQQRLAPLNVLRLFPCRQVVAPEVLVNL